MRYAVRRVALIVVLAVASCSSSHRRSLPSDWDLVPTTGDRVSSRSVVIVADNQLHDVYSEPAELIRTGLADRYVSVAIRPPALDLFGQDFLALVLELSPKTPVVHLGDGANISARDEFTSFLRIMARAGRGWFLAPGNHDGFFFGNEHLDPRKSRWADTTAKSGGPLTKSMAVRLYLAALAHRPEHAELRDALGIDGPSDGEEVVAYATRVEPSIRAEGRADGADGFLRAIAWSIDDEKPWTSWVVQWVDLTNVDVKAGAILIDTAAYRSRPALLPSPFGVNAGLSGDLLDGQAAAARRWVDGAPDQAWVLMGHHPYDALTRGGRAALDALRLAARARLYVSAHTHAGRSIVHARPDDERGADLDDPEAWLELNVGSILDYPQEYATLRCIRVTEAGSGERRGFSWSRTSIVDLLEERSGAVDWKAWLPKPNEPDAALRYARRRDLDSIAAESDVKNGLLALHARLIRLFATDEDRVAEWPRDPATGVRLDSTERVLGHVDSLLGDGTPLAAKGAFLAELRRFEESRPLRPATGGEADPAKMREVFRRQLAYTASWYEVNELRLPLPDGSTVIFPADR